MNKHEKIGGTKQLNIKDAEVRELAEELSRRTGETLTGAIKSALREKLDRQTSELGKEERLARVRALIDRYSGQIGPRTMTDEEAVGYGEFGEPI